MVGADSYPYIPTADTFRVVFVLPWRPAGMHMITTHCHPNPFKGFPLPSVLVCSYCITCIGDTILCTSYLRCTLNPFAV